MICMLRQRFHLMLRSIRFISESQNVSPKYFVTTPIFYVNAAPHIGHLYSALLADAASRWQRLLGCEVLFSTGTDEHGLKIQQAAKAADKEPLSFCHEVSYTFKNLFQEADIAYTDFIRTTEDRHRKAVEHFWKKLEKNGYLYKGNYEGWYSTQDEAFLSADQVTDKTDPDGQTVNKVSLESGHPVEWTKEENYMFRLSEFRSRLLDWINRGVIKPAKFEGILRQLLVADLSDLSVSRQRSRLQWGIPVPGDDTQTIYVWLDALINYLTVAGYPDSHAIWWPSTYHIVGQDILKFHAVFWPAFLMACNMEPPKGILCHSHWLMNHEKMSKSKGNVIDPFDRIQRYTTDGFRYFLLKQGVPSTDSNYSDDKVIIYLNSDLSNSLGNLLNRSVSKSINKSAQYPDFDYNVFVETASADDLRMVESLQQLSEQVGKHYEDFNFYKGIDCIMSQIRDTNRHFTTHQPWELAKDPKQERHLLNVLHVTLETLCVCGILLQPIIPTIAGNLLNRLSVGTQDRGLKEACSPGLVNSNNDKSGSTRPGRLLSNDNAILFERLS